MPFHRCRQRRPFLSAAPGSHPSLTPLSISLTRLIFACMGPTESSMGGLCSCRSLTSFVQGAEREQKGGGEAAEEDPGGWRREGNGRKRRRATEEKNGGSGGLEEEQGSSSSFKLKNHA